MKTSAQRKRDQRTNALTKFGVRSRTTDLTDAEYEYLRRCYLRRFGHDWTLASRKQAQTRAESCRPERQLEIFQDGN